MSGDPVGLDLAAVADFLDATAPGLRTGSLSGEVIAGGRSNLTYRITDGASRWVLRRPPLGHVLATAHDMGREARVLTALHGSAVPVPAVLAVCPDADVIGAPFYVMTLVEGRVLRTTAQLEAFGPEAAAALADAQTVTLAALHTVDPASVGLGDLGRPEGYLERQVARWAGQVAKSLTRPLPAFDALRHRLEERLAADAGREPLRAAVVHGDYRLDNLLVAEDGSVAAVLDWEMATLGDPLTDLANAVIWWDGVAGLGSPVAAVPGSVPGFPPSARLVERYAAETGTAPDGLDRYVAFAYYKLAAICQGIAFRTAQGLTVGEGFEHMAAMVDPLIERGHAALDA